MSKFCLGKNVPSNYSYAFTRKEVKILANKLVNVCHFSNLGISPHNQVKDSGKRNMARLYHRKAHRRELEFFSIFLCKQYRVYERDFQVLPESIIFRFFQMDRNATGTT